MSGDIAAGKSLEVQETDSAAAGAVDALAMAAATVPTGGTRVNLFEPMTVDQYEPIYAEPTLGVGNGPTNVFADGSFSITDWTGYPEGLPKPDGPFQLLEGDEYSAARAAANQANRAIHAADPTLNGLQIHEIQPVKFGGNPTDPVNKIPLPPGEHAPATRWWNQLQRDLTK